jgi:DNA polymerase epsilon subunit 1
MTNRTPTTPTAQRKQVWRGEHFSCKRSEYNAVKRQLASETFGPAAEGEGGGGRDWGKGRDGGGGGNRDGAGGSKDGDGGGAAAARAWGDLSREEQARLLKDRLKKYCQKVGEGARSVHKLSGRWGATT